MKRAEDHHFNDPLPLEHIGDQEPYESKYKSGERKKRDFTSKSS